MTYAGGTGPAWFRRLFPYGLGTIGYPGFGGRLTRREAAVLHMVVCWGWSDEAVVGAVPRLTPAALARLKAAVNGKWADAERAYYESRGHTVLRASRVLP